APEDEDSAQTARKPLGGWEVETIGEGVYFMSPGRYFRLQPKLKDIRARGLGRKEVFEHYERLLQAFLDWDREDFNYSVELVSRRFHGAKTAVYAMSRHAACDTSWSGGLTRGCPECGRLGDEFRVKEKRMKNGKPALGQWEERAIHVKFDPRPKREAMMFGNWRGALEDSHGAN